MNQSLDVVLGVRPPNGIELIAAERQRQITQEGWTPEHDDIHQNGELAVAAFTYSSAALLLISGGTVDEVRKRLAHPWPWSLEWFKVSADPIRNLEKAGALLAAEIDRLKRVEAAKQEITQVS